jgi:hypothetical protein
MTANGGSVDLTPRTLPTANTSEVTIAQWTIPQWKHMMKHQTGWDALLDGVSEKVATQALGVLAHPDKDAREVACKLVKVLGIDAYGDHASDAVAVLRALETSDPDRGVRAAAKDAAEALAEAIETRAVRAEFPWSTSYDGKAAPQALAALDDDRAAVRRRVYAWWTCVWDVPDTIRTKVAAKLQLVITSESDDQIRTLAEEALEHLRELDQNER